MKTISSKVMVAMLAGGLLMCLGLAWQMLSMKETNTEEAGLKAAETMSQQIKAFRSYYTSEILARAKKGGLTANFDFQDHDTVLPLPASLVYVLGEKISKDFPGTEIRLYSNFPFPNRGADETAQDSFESEALAALNKDAETPVWRMEERNGRLVMRYVTAETMKEGCVACHNSHVDSPKLDWNVGDVRGGLEVIVPVDDIEASMAEHTVQLLVISGLGIVVIIFGMVWFLRRSVIQPVEIIQAAAGRLADGDLRADANYKSEDELGQLADAFNRMSSNLRDVMGQVSSSTGQLNTAADELSAVTE